MGKNITKLPSDDRPYEKLELLGSENLSNSELLAIIIKTGKKNLNCLEIAQNILSGNSNSDKISDLEYLTTLSKEQLIRYEGIGRVKAIQIQALVELSKRISRNKCDRSSIKMTCPKDVYNLVIESYIGKKQEILKTILVNNSNKLISIITNAQGSTNMAIVGIKEIFSEPIKQMASGIFIVHNHPSGVTIPSKNDIEFTKKIKENGEIFGIKLLDHIIISDNGYTSLYENGDI
ncbi:MAG: DNA repair protein RadC [Clostridia bacterium]|nr:DNA repair protein RadC [Clostridia bacterium]